MNKKLRNWIIWIAVIVVVGVFVALAVMNYLDRNRSEGGDGYFDYDIEESLSYPSSVSEPMMERAFDSDDGFAVGNALIADESISKQSVGDTSIERLIIRTGSLSMVVTDVHKSIEAISKYARENGGFVVSSNVSKGGIDVYGDVTIRIPSDKFDRGVSDVKAMGEVTDESVYGQDVTEEYVDLDARLGTLKATEVQFLEIMKKAEEIEDILAVQRELNWIRQDIESIEGRMKYLRESSDLSTLTVYLSTDPGSLPVLDEEETWKPFAVFKEALRSIIEVGKGFVNALIWVVVYSPVIIILLLILWGIMRHFKKGKRRGKRKK